MGHYTYTLSQAQRWPQRSHVATTATAKGVRRPSFPVKSAKWSPIIDRYIGIRTMYEKNHFQLFAPTSVLNAVMCCNTTTHATISIRWKSKTPFGATLNTQSCVRRGQYILVMLLAPRTSSKTHPLLCIHRKGRRHLAFNHRSHLPVATMGRTSVRRALYNCELGNEGTKRTMCCQRSHDSSSTWRDRRMWERP